ncbi:hypothetical protein WJR50_23190 [Catalinimonas sp. 4WD22]|jgi:hypothetical protein|uniref:hypothetical protein n=1 Tax=Catalinimonas locisalis TaxID=3133978 RepID=UPI003101A1CC
MEKTILNIPVLQKSKGTRKVSAKTIASCCAQPASGESCCSPSQSPEENEGECCAQPEDGSACCNK